MGDQAVSDALTRVFHRVDEQLKAMGAFNLGTTAAKFVRISMEMASIGLLVTCVPS